MWAIVKKLLGSNSLKSNKKILVIADDDFLNKILSRQYQILTASDDRSGLQMAGQHRPDLILLNAVLCGQKTLDLCIKLKDNKDTKNIPVLIIAEKGNDADITKFYLYGIEGYFIKPLTAKEILHHINKLWKVN